MAENTSYKKILQTTFLFGFVQAFNIGVKVCINKIVAILLGAEGMGIISLFQSASGMLKTGCGLGINQSAVRDVSEAFHSHDDMRIAYIMAITRRIIIFTALFGFVLTFLLSPWLSVWTFGNSDYTISFLGLALVVGMMIYADGQLAILTGMRRMRDLAKANLIGSCVGLVTAIPFYYMWGVTGIVPSLIMTSFCSLFFSVYFVRKLHIHSPQISIKYLFVEAKPMVQMGVALMLVSFMSYAFSFIVSSYIRYRTGLQDVGYYQAGVTIITSYFGIVLSAMTTDYYPRISAINNDNRSVEKEMNSQAETGLILIFPIAVLFVWLAPQFLHFLYANEFQVATQYTDFAIIGTVTIVVSNCIGMILLAKQAAKVFILSVLFQRILSIGVYMLLYSWMGLRGLGYAYIIYGCLHLVVTSIIVGHSYKIFVSRKIFLLLVLVIGFILMAYLLRQIETSKVGTIFGGLLTLLSIIISYYYMRCYMHLDIVKSIKNKLNRRK